MSQTSTNTPKVMPSYSSLWEAHITNLCHPHLIQMQRCPAPLMPAAPSTTTVFCSPPHPEMFLWALCLQTTSPSETSSQSTTCPMEKLSSGSMTQQALLQPKEKALTVTATTPPTHTPPPPDLEQPAVQHCRLSSWRYKVALLTRDSASPPDGGGTTIHNPQPALGPLTTSQPSEGPASPEDIPTEDATPPGGHHVPPSGENPTSPAEAAEPAILGGF